MQKDGPNPNKVWAPDRPPCWETKRTHLGKEDEDPQARHGLCKAQDVIQGGADGPSEGKIPHSCYWHLLWRRCNGSQSSTLPEAWPDASNRNLEN